MAGDHSPAVADREGLRVESIGEETEIPDSHESFRLYMQEEAAQEPEGGPNLASWRQTRLVRSSKTRCPSRAASCQADAACRRLGHGVAWHGSPRAPRSARQEGRRCPSALARNDPGLLTRSYPLPAPRNRRPMQDALIRLRCSCPRANRGVDADRDEDAQFAPTASLRLGHDIDSRTLMRNIWRNAVLSVGHSNRAQMGHSWRAPRALPIKRDLKGT